ncbi:MAG TPA: hypothetical protein VGQ31_03545 [Candidatus Limnocylindrales bacterium]|nr:hypothetical protein [Candidatus Limnocylindrales bacterium]
MPDDGRDVRPVVEALDFLYTPSRDVAADTAELTGALGGRVIFAIEDGGVRVAMIELAGAPRLLLTDHLEGDRPILVYRVADLRAACDDLARRGWTPERSLEIPQGPCSSFRSAGGHRIALYQASRPQVLLHFEGRRDF